MLDHRTSIPALRKTVTVAATTDRAFEIFTAHVHQWWPLRTHSVAEADAVGVVFGGGVGGRIVETMADGTSATWGTVVAGDPPRRVAFTWHPGNPEVEAGHVRRGVILLDTSGLLAAIDGSQNQHAKAAAVLRHAGGPLLLSPFVLAEIDYLLATRVSPGAQHALLDEVVRGAYRLESFTAEDVASAVAILGRYRDLDIGLADASIVVLAERRGVLDLLTLDHRHFQALRGPGGRRFRIRPTA